MSNYHICPHLGFAFVALIVPLTPTIKVAHSSWTLYAEAVCRSNIHPTALFQKAKVCHIFENIKIFQVEITELVLNSVFIVYLAIFNILGGEI